MLPYLPELYITIYQSCTLLFTKVVHHYLYQLWYIAIYRLHAAVPVTQVAPSGADMQHGFCARRICAYEVIIQLKYLAS